VNKQFLIHFSIGKYKDGVLCDVVPMEATHVLLGRPWQFDKRVLHDGFTDKLSFDFHGHKVTVPSRTRALTKSKSKSASRSKST